MVVTPPAVPIGLQQLADLAPLVAVFTEEREEEGMFFLRPLCTVSQLRVKVVLPAEWGEGYRSRHCLLVRLAFVHPASTALRLNS